MLIFQLGVARQLYQVIQGSKFHYKHCWNLLKHSPKWLVIVNNQKPKRRRFKASSLSNLEFEHLEVDDILQVLIVILERPLRVKAKKERLKK